MKDADKSVVVGIDVGGTNTKMGLVSRDMRVLALDTFPTETEDRDVFIRSIAESLEKLKQKVPGANVRGLGVGVPDAVGEDGQTVISNFGGVKCMENWNIAEALRDATGLPISVSNDALAHTLGEYHSLAAPPRSFAVVTLGTGVGFGWIFEGRPFPPATSGGMSGHVSISLDGPRCYCGGRGCAESYLSATGLLSLAKQAMQTHPGTSLSQFADELTTEHIFEQAARDVLANKLMDEYVRNLGTYLQTIFYGFFADTIVLGGGLACGLAPRLDELQQVLDGLSRCDGKRTIVRISTLGDEAGILGAAALAAGTSIDEQVL